MTPQRGYACLRCPPALQITTGSDVYSFGVLMWSVYTGQQPYELEGGVLIPNTLFPHFPTTAPPRYKVLAERCLQRYPHRRPTFAEISDSLVALYSKEVDGPRAAPAGSARPAPAPPTLHVQMTAAATSTPAADTATITNFQISNSTANGPYGLTTDSHVDSMHCAIRSQLASCLLSGQPPPQQQQEEAPEEAAAVASGRGQGQ